MLMRESELRRLIRESWYDGSEKKGEWVIDGTQNRWVPYRKEEYEYDPDLDEIDDEELEGEAFSERERERAGLYNDIHLEPNMRWNKDNYPGIEKKKWWGKDNMPAGEYDPKNIDYGSIGYKLIYAKQVYNHYVFMRDGARWKVQDSLKKLRNCVDEEECEVYKREIEVAKSNYRDMSRNVIKQREMIDEFESKMR